MKIQKVHKLTCSQCGTQFFAKRAGAKFCKPACQMASFRASREYRQAQLAAEYERQQAELNQSVNQPTEPTETKDAA